MIGKHKTAALNPWYTPGGCIILGGGLRSVIASGYHMYNCLHFGALQQ